MKEFAFVSEDGRVLLGPQSFGSEPNFDPSDSVGEGTWVEVVKGDGMLKGDKAGKVSRKVIDSRLVVDIDDETLEEAKSRLLKEVNNRYDQFLSCVIEKNPNKAEMYRIKTNQALNVLSGGKSNTIANEATTRGISNTEMANKILEKAEIAENAILKLEEARIAFKVGIEKSSSIAEAESLAKSTIKRLSGALPDAIKDGKINK